MAERGLAYGPSFRAIQRLWSGQGEALAAIAAPAVPDVAAYRAHPALLDAAFQVLVSAAESHSGLAAGRPLFLPTKIRELRWHGDPGAAFWVTAAVREVTSASVTGDLRIIGDDGRLCADVFGFTARLIETAADRSQDSVDQWLYDYRWEPQPGEPRHDATADVGDSAASVGARAAAGRTRARGDPRSRHRPRIGHGMARLLRPRRSAPERHLRRLHHARRSPHSAACCSLAPGSRPTHSVRRRPWAGGARWPISCFDSSPAPALVRPLGDAWTATGVVPRATAAELSEHAADASFPRIGSTSSC